MLDDERRENLRDLGALILRVGMALPLLVIHGWPKWTNFAERADSFADPLEVGTTVSLSLATFAEVGCALLLLVGLATRFAGLVIAGMFAIIVFVVDAGKPWSEVELAWLYGIVALSIALVGPGRISVDAIVGFMTED